MRRLRKATKATKTRKNLIDQSNKEATQHKTNENNPRDLSGKLCMRIDLRHKWTVATIRISNAEHPKR